MMHEGRTILIGSVLLVGACAGLENPGDVGTRTAEVTTPFTWKMAGVLVKQDQPLTASAGQLIANHFSYVGQYIVNGCANNNTPYSCDNNQCNYPGRPYAELPNYTQLRDWMNTYRNAGLYVGAWGQAPSANVEAEAHCMAEVLNTLRNTHGVTATFFVVAAEKNYEFNNFSTRYVAEFNKTISFSLAKAESPECHIAIEFGAWTAGGFDIAPQAYWNENGSNPKYCLDWCVQNGVPKDRCHVLLDGYKHGAKSGHAWSEYAADLKAFQDQTAPASQDAGFAIWLTLDPDEWDLWGPLIANHKIAVYDGSAPPAPTTCARYSATNTNNANRNYATCNVTLSAGQQIKLGTCGVPGASGSGDTYLRLFLGGTQVAANDDSCGLLSQITYTATSSGTYTIREGCYANGSCSGTVGFQITGGGPGPCSDACTNGAKRCLDGDRWEECRTTWDADACTEWGGVWSCAQSYPGTTCSNGFCVGGCSDACTNGAKRCLDGDRWEECRTTWDADACTEWGGVWSCSQSYPGTVCSGGYCVNSCVDECGSGAKRCIDGDAWQECRNWDADACLEWGGWWSCSQSYPGTVCSGGYCVGCVDECGAGAKRCIDNDAWQECGNWDGDSCLEFGGWWSCAQSYPGTHCSSGYCVY